MPPRNVASPPVADDPYAAQRAAFLAQERSSGGFDFASRPDFDDDGVSYGGAAVRRAADRSILVAYVLWIFAGPLAAHRFYCGRYGSGVFQAATGLLGFGFLFTEPYNISTWGPLLIVHGLWRFIDLFLIPGMCKTPSAL
ncbi:TM2 domain-containing protein [Sphingomonas panacisoli]|uniref:TM2 domain-containing protein n=2 Tax=Sphingomonas panacisoli TaxID=1813879 RepID=A0A5B8LNE2_9SPHN|nr:TM2 domain-containing protein [Sphingomonas panacisoli]